MKALDETEAEEREIALRMRVQELEALLRTIYARVRGSQEECGLFDTIEVLLDKHRVNLD